MWYSWPGTGRRPTLKPFHERIGSADRQPEIVSYVQPNVRILVAWVEHREVVRSLSFSPDDVRFTTAGEGSTVPVSSSAEGRDECAFTVLGWDVKCVEVESPAGSARVRLTPAARIFSSFRITAPTIVIYTSYSA